MSPHQSASGACTIVTIASCWLSWLGECTTTWIMANSDVPLWYHEVQYLEHPHHPLLNQKVPPIFLTRFLQHSLWLPKLLYEANAPFIAPLILWEFSRDAFLP